MSTTAQKITVAATATAALFLSACSSTVAGSPTAASTPTSQASVATTTAKAPAHSGRSSTPPSAVPTTTFTSTQDVVQFFVNDVNAFWKWYNIQTKAIAVVQSQPLSCGASEPESQDAHAMNCTGTIHYDPDALAAEANGDNNLIGVVMAHEVGHTVERRLDSDPNRSDRSHELSADCLAGMYVSAKQEPYEEMAAVFKKTGMYVYGQDDALAAFHDGYNNYSPDVFTHAQVKKCLR